MEGLGLSAALPQAEAEDLAADRGRAVTQCRACGSARLETVLDLGRTPLANALVSSLDEPAPEYPLAIALCRDCALVQTTHQVPGEVLFGRNYPYFSSYSRGYLEHARENAEALVTSLGLGADSFVVEIASNDGYLLRNFVARGIPVLGIDPAEGPAAAAERAGVPTLRNFFGTALARRLRTSGPAADLVVGNNVLAHVDDVNDMVAGVAALLAGDGVGVFEAPYLVDLVERCAFDTIYHEHNGYFSLTALAGLFARHGLGLFDVQRLPVHGGSLRVFVGRGREPGPAARALLAEEERAGVATPAYYSELPRRVEAVLSGLRALLGELHQRGERVAGYGATAKGASLASLAGLGPELVEYVVDRNPSKQGHYLPGVRIPIVSTRRLEEDPPDHLLLFAWNLADEVRGQLAGRFRGGYIVPVPTPHRL